MLTSLLACVLALGNPSAPYVDAVRALNEKHAKDPGKETEEELAKKLPPAAVKALDALLAAKASKDLDAALIECAEAALDLDRVADYQKIRARLAKDDPAAAGKLDAVLSRPRVLLRGEGGLDEEYLKAFAEVFEGVLGAYDEVFGFGEFSKVPGKKLRLRLRLVEKIESPPHFAPEFPFHSEIDFPVVDARKLASPTADGKFLFFGLCHELGHVVAMWDLPGKQVDYHAWADYTGAVIVQHFADAKEAPAWLKGLRDAQWRSLEKMRAEWTKEKPALDSYKGVIATLVALHDRVGPRAIGQAIAELDAKDQRRRINRVRYYTFEEFKKSLAAAVAKDKDKAKAVGELLP